MNRETWLLNSIEQLQKRVFKRSQLTPLKVSVGFPYGSRGTKRIGEYWCPTASEDKKASIFISPQIGDGCEALATLAHELVHAIAGPKAGHGPEFRRLALSIGLVGKMRSTKAGPILIKELQEIITALGPYPHGKLNIEDNSRKKQTTRMFKMQCSECGYTVRGSKSSILFRGTVICPCNFRQMETDSSLDAAEEQDFAS